MAILNWLYYGEEIGMFGTKGSGGGYYDEYRREPLDWYATGRGDGMATWFRPGDRNNLSNDNISVEEQENDPESLLNHYRALGAYRNATPALRGGFGSFEFSKEGEDLYGAWRGDLAGDFVLVIINFSAEDVTATLDDATIPVTDLGAMEIPFSEGFSANGLEFTIAAGGYAILQ
jgi:alpha-amylase